MADTTSVATRFKQVRERAGLSLDEAASRMGVSPESLWDIEGFEGDLSTCYSPSEVRKFCHVLNIRPVELFGVETKDPPITAEELVRLTHEECRLRGISLEQFEEVVGWRLSMCIEPASKLLEDITVDGLQWLCRELGIDWHRAI